MLEAALSTSPVVTRLLVGALVRPQKHVSRAPPCRRNMPARALCITISDDRGDESFADDLNMGRGIVSGRVALLLRSTEIRPHRPNDLLPPFPPPHTRVPPLPPSLRHLVILHLAKLFSHPHTPGCYLDHPWCTLDSTLKTLGTPQSGLPLPLAAGLGTRAGTRDSRRDSLSLLAPGLPVPPAPGLATGLGTLPRGGTLPVPARVGARGGAPPPAGGRPLPARVGTRGGTLPVPARVGARDGDFPLPPAPGLAAGPGGGG